MDSLVDEVNAAAAAYKTTNDTRHRMELREKARLLYEASTTPGERIDMIRFAPTLQTCLRMAYEMGLLQTLTEFGGKASASDLAEKTGRDAQLIERILRPLTGTGLLDEVGPAQYAANETTQYSLKKGIIGSVKVYNDTVFHAYAQMGRLSSDPEWKGFPTATIGDPFKEAMGKPLFAWLAEHPDYNQAFADFMIDGRSTTARNWWDIFPVQDALAAKPVKQDPEAALLVDVGGGQGQWTTRFKASLDRAPTGRLIVQDLPGIINSAVKVEGVEYIGYDFTQPQPVRGARFYFLKAIIHDWPDEKCLEILTRVREAMENGYSTLLIMDQVFPEQGVALRDACLDVAIMVQLGGVERNEKQFRTLLQSAGFKVVKIWRREDVLQGNESVIECEKI